MEEQTLDINQLLTNQLQIISNSAIYFTPILTTQQILSEEKIIYPCTERIEGFEEIYAIIPPQLSNLLSTISPQQTFIPQIQFDMIVEKAENQYLLAPTYVSQIENKYSVCLRNIPFIFTYIPESPFSALYKSAMRLRVEDLKPDILQSYFSGDFSSDYYYPPRILSYKYKMFLKKEFSDSISRLNQIFHLVEQDFIYLKSQDTLPINSRLYLPFYSKIMIFKQLHIFQYIKKQYKIYVILSNLQKEIYIDMDNTLTVEKFYSVYLNTVLYRCYYYNFQSQYQLIDENLQIINTNLPQTFYLRQIQADNQSLQMKQIRLEVDISVLKWQKMQSISNLPQKNWKFDLRTYLVQCDESQFNPQISYNGLCKYREVPFAEEQFCLTDSEKNDIFTEFHNKRQYKPQKQAYLKNAYEIEYIVARKPLHQKQSKFYPNIQHQQFLIHWVGYRIQDRTWEPEENVLENCCAVIAFNQVFGQLDKNSVNGLLDEQNLEEIQVNLVKLQEKIYNEQ
eukprot:EST41799.1 Chromodomain-containing protein [Spironucleus salmonicida]